MTTDGTSIDVDLTAQEIAGLTSTDALAAFVQRLGYDTGKRTALSPESIGLNDADKAFRTIELLSEDPEGFLRVVCVQVRSLTVKARTDLVRSLSRFNQDHLIIMASDFQVLELVLIDKVKRRQQSPATVAAYKPVPRVYAIQRKAPNRLDLRILRRLTFTQRDGLEQFDKLRSVFQAAAYTNEYYQNRALFADHYLDTRLREDAVWSESPNVAFAAVKGLAANARERLGHRDESATRQDLIEPLFDALGFNYEAGKDARSDVPTPDYLLKDADGKLLTATLVYQWDRWLDGPDPGDQHTPDENPGASVVSVLERGQADWVIVTNGKLWRLYSRHAHSRSTNFYEVDLEEILNASAETDPGEAFRYWWLFFRQKAFRPLDAEQAEIQCWLDTVVAGSRDYAKQVEERLKRRVFEHIVPHLAMGFLHDRKTRLAISKRPSEEELEEIREGALTLLYRLLFLLYAESRDLLPVRESAYYDASFKHLKQEAAEAAGPSETDADDKLRSAYRKDQTDLYDRLQRLFGAMDAGDPVLNVPTYNGGLFLTKPDKTDDSREACISRFLRNHKIPDLFLARAIDHLSRDPDERSFALVFIDYKSLGVRQLGSIYEGLLEFRLRIAEEDLTTVKVKGKEKVIPLSEARSKRAEIAVRKGEVYLANDKSERRASGSYYTPDHIVEYIVENTVGPVLATKLEELRSEFRKVEKTYQRHMDNLRAAPGLVPGKWANKAQFEALAKARAVSETYASHSDLVERFFDMKVLDPAMGSGHFLVQAVDFITDKLLDFLNSFPRNPVSTALERTRQSTLESLTEQGISVDPDRLTDVHLLKRHVLKRCIYGVDLNPMAVELAKVSLWLDAFTLGAPLSFLDHHLRYGNSLIGATFVDLEKAREGLMFPLDYEPLHRAINHVLLVARLTDATAAEVHRSADQYAAAYKDLSGYRIVLDVLTAQHFGHKKAVDLIQVYGDELDFDSAAALLKAMRAVHRSMVEDVEALAEEHRFFHWELEFPEVFFGPRPGAERQIEHKPKDEAGFDAIVGNPPYVRQETIKQDKPYLKAAFSSTFDASCDLYVYFMEREITLLRAGGIMGMIVANKWQRAAYGKRLREFLVRRAKPLSIVDFGHSPVFPDADTFPCVPILSRRMEPLGCSIDLPQEDSLLVCHYPREQYDPNMSLMPYVTANVTELPIRLLDSTGWSLDDATVLLLLDKIRRIGVPLREVVASKPVYGLKTGCNEAFYIDEDTKRRLIAENPQSVELIRPLLRGRDIDRWRGRSSNRYIIVARHRTDINKYPAIKKHLHKHRKRLEPCPDKWRVQEDGKWPGRAKGPYHWWQLQSSPDEDFMAMIDSPKIVYQEIQFHSWFALEPGGSCPNNKVFLLPNSDMALLAVLNSPLMWWVLTRTLPHMKDEALSPAGFIMENLRVVVPGGNLRDRIVSITEHLYKHSEHYHAWEGDTLASLQEVVGRETLDDRCLTWLRRPATDFVRMMRTRMKCSVTPALETRLAKLHEKMASELGSFLLEQLNQEKRLAGLVEDAYGLTLEERLLLHNTRPVRDPIDVLEARLKGMENLSSAAQSGDE